ncbi:MAG: LuxR family transcriptional regulator [Candidatus Solibacter sp.]|nr:LuxR family transcriptional regulator [Candidatus Solibacter sp.]
MVTRIPPTDDRPMAVLTRRQLQILVLIANGMNAKEIAGMLHISSKTVGCHRSNIMRRLGIHDVAGLVRYSIRNGLVKA